MADKPLLDDVLIYARSTGTRGKENFREFFRVGPEVFDSLDAAMSTANKTARQRRVSVWVITENEPPALLRTFR